MAKTKKDAVLVRLKCIYSGEGAAPGPGDEIELDAAEAARLIEIGAAEAVVAPADAPAPDANAAPADAPAPDADAAPAAPSDGEAVEG